MRIELNGLSAGPDAARPILTNLNLQIGSGEQVAIIGPSGAGKTTLLHVAGLALAPVQGTVRLDGEDGWTMRSGTRRQWRARLLIAPQAPPLPPRQRVVTAVLAARLAQMGFWRSLASLIAPRDLEAVAQALAQLDVADKLFERVDRLSGGERQRVSLARALLSPARLWLIDEPLSALDPSRARQVIEVLTSVARARGVTVLASFHQVDVALAFFPRILGVRAGKVLFDLAPERVGPAELRALYGNDIALGDLK